VGEKAKSYVQVRDFRIPAVDSAARAKSLKCGISGSSQCWAHSTLPLFQEWTDITPIWKPTYLQHVCCLEVRTIPPFLTLVSHKPWVNSKEKSLFHITRKDIQGRLLYTKNPSRIQGPWAQGQLCFVSNSVLYLYQLFLTKISLELRNWEIYC
jgi:hypothetical protein